MAKKKRRTNSFIRANQALADKRRIIINPRTKKPYALSTINNDLKALHEDWVEWARENMHDAKGRQLAELAELRRVAWRIGNHELVLRTIRQEMEILGTAAPKRTELENVGDRPLLVIDV